MSRPKVIVIASNFPLNNDAHLKHRMTSAEQRATRQAVRFPGMDLSGMQQKVHQNILQLLLSINGRYFDLLDLLNYTRNGRHSPNLAPENVDRHYALANTVTLNGIYLYQFLRNNGFEPIIVQNYSTADLQEILRERPLAVCISSNFVSMEDIRGIAQQIKRFEPETTVIAGGMLVKKVLHGGENFAPDAVGYFSTFQQNVDVFVVEAQGEQTLLQVLRALRDRAALDAIPNLARFDKDGTIVFSRREPEELSMDQTAISWDKVPRDYLRKALPVNTSRGCFYRCRFCTYHWYSPEVHYKSLDVLRHELRLINDLGFVSHVRFTDDNFTANKQRLGTVLDMMIQDKLNFKWSAFARASALSPALVTRMKAAGCEFVDMGLESGSQTILNNMDKRVNRSQALAAIRMLNDAEIYSRGSFIVGYPGETTETFSETVDFINESGLPYYHPYLFYYSKSSPVHEDRGKFDLEGLGLAWRHKTMDAVEASSLMSQMIRRIPNSFTDGLTYVEEIYKILRGERYSPAQIHDLFRLKRELQLAVQETGSDQPFAPRVDTILASVEKLVH
jgi:radical SAM superfamily enzyme YgiQ (UPF0313 family)